MVIEHPRRKLSKDRSRKADEGDTFTIKVIRFTPEGVAGKKGGTTVGSDQGRKEEQGQPVPLITKKGKKTGGNNSIQKAIYRTFTDSFEGKKKGSAAPIRGGESLCRAPTT